MREKYIQFTDCYLVLEKRKSFDDELELGRTSRCGLTGDCQTKHQSRDNDGGRRFHLIAEFRFSRFGGFEYHIISSQ